MMRETTTPLGTRSKYVSGRRWMWRNMSLRICRSICCPTRVMMWNWTQFVRNEAK